MVISGKHKVGELVAIDYRTAEVFTKYGIDFCCKGNLCIDEVVKKKKIDQRGLFSDLKATTRRNHPRFSDFRKWPLDLLVDYILIKHHHYTKEKIPLVQRYLRKICLSNGNQHPELFEIAEQKAANHFPHYKKIQYEEDEDGNLLALDDLEEEIGLYMAEVMMELEEEGEVKVKEHVDLDLQHDCGIGLDVGLHIDKVTSNIIESFIRDFNADKLVLDPGYYSFQTQADMPKT